MHVVLTNAGADAARGLSALRDTLIAMGMTVLSVVPDCPERPLASGGMRSQQRPASDTANPVVHVTGNAAEGIRHAMLLAMAGDARVIVAGIQVLQLGENAVSSAAFAAAATGARHGRAALCITMHAPVCDTDYHRIADLAAEVAALVFTYPRRHAVVHLDVPAGCGSLLPVLRQPLRFGSSQPQSPVSARGGCAVGPRLADRTRPSLCVLGVEPTDATDEADSEAWAMSMMNLLEQRLAGVEGDCGCCNAPLANGLARPIERTA